MLMILKENMGNIIAGTILVVIVLLIIKKLIKDKKAGNGCSGCSSSCNCACSVIEERKK